MLAPIPRARVRIAIMASPPSSAEFALHVKRGQYVLIPISDQTRGHGTHSKAAVWKQYLEELLGYGPGSTVVRD